MPESSDPISHPQDTVAAISVAIQNEAKPNVKRTGALDVTSPAGYVVS